MHTISSLMQKEKMTDKQIEASNDVLQSINYFPSTIYTVDKPDFLPMAKKVTNDAIKKTKKQQKLDEIYPVYMTENLFNDERMAEFSKYVGDTAWQILFSQGYQMGGLSTFFLEMWTQEHYKHSSMEQHIHGFGAQIVGFYFIDAPENCSRVVFHDPKAAKVQINLPEIDTTQATFASNMVNFVPRPGMLMFTNSWLAHSFTRHASDKPIRFIHFTLAVQTAPQQSQTVNSSAEVV